MDNEDHSHDEELHVREVPTQAGAILKARIIGPLCKMFNKYTNVQWGAQNGMSLAQFGKFLADCDIVPHLLPKINAENIFSFVLSETMTNYRKTGTLPLPDFASTLWFLAEASFKSSTLSASVDKPENILLGIFTRDNLLRCNTLILEVKAVHSATTHMLAHYSLSGLHGRQVARQKSFRRRRIFK